jgi:hypothetical protein
MEHGDRVGNGNRDRDGSSDNGRGGRMASLRAIVVARARPVVKVREIGTAMVITMESIRQGRRQRCSRKGRGKSVWHHVFVVEFPCFRTWSL